jgi:ABC-2 type transport system permease protein
MTTLVGSAELRELRGELPKLLAFLRRDAITAWSYRVSFFSDWVALAFQAGLFYLIGRMVDPANLPTYGGTRATYMEFVAIGIAVSVFLGIAVMRVSAQIRQEQLAGTLEALLLTPTKPLTIQLGSVAYDLLYIPVRTAGFLLVVGLAFGLRFEASGILPAALILLAFIPFVWGLGIMSAAATLTVRRGNAGVGWLLTLMTIVSAAYFPLAVLPDWLESAANANPLSLAVGGMREALLGGISSGKLLHTLGLLALASLCCIVLAGVVFRLALSRERRRGSLGQY